MIEHARAKAFRSCSSTRAEKQGKKLTYQKPNDIEKPFRTSVVKSSESLLVSSVRIDSLVLDEERDDGEVAFERSFVESGLGRREGKRRSAPARINSVRSKKLERVERDSN